MEVYWLEQTAPDVPDHDVWLSHTERLRLVSIAIPKRRGDWRLGRWTAKRAVAMHLDRRVDPEALSTIEIVAAASGCPEVFVHNKPASVVISLTHCSGRAVCAVARRGVRIGCDLELIESHSNAFLRDYFTIEEQHVVELTPLTERDAVLAVLWSAKESALKALQTGLRVDTRCVTVRQPHCRPSSDASIWRPLEVCSSFGDIFAGWWQHADGFVRTLVADPPPQLPVTLELTRQAQ